MKKHAVFYLTSLITMAAAVACLADDATPAGTVATAVAVPTAPAPTTTTTPAPVLPYSVTEVVKMYQAGISKEVLLGYVANSAVPFHLTADSIIQLQHLGLPQEVSAAMIRRDGDLQKQAAAYQPPPPQQPVPMQAAAPASPQAAPDAAAPPVVVPGAPPPAVYPYTYTDAAAPPVVYPDYAYPYYGYPYYYGPNVVVGGWWGPGWGWGRGGFYGHGGFGGGHGGHR